MMADDTPESRGGVPPALDDAPAMDDAPGRSALSGDESSPSAGTTSPVRTRSPRLRSTAAERRRRIFTVLLVAGLCVVGFVVWAALWYEGQVSGSRGGASTIVYVTKGDSFGQVSTRLSDQHVISSSVALRIYLTLHGTPVVLPGGYYLHQHEGFAGVRSALAAGPDVFDLYVPPGFTVAETAQRVGLLPGHDASSFASLATSGALHSPFQPAGSKNLDGLLGTGTYVVVPGESDTTLLEQMIDRFDTEATSVGLEQGSATFGLTPYQLVTVASIVEKEGVYPQNLSKVARVIYNRLAIGMDLQMNATVLYAEGRDGGPVSSADLELDTPYNTYLFPGLTPTPICFPSQASLRAALAPAPGNWLYFVVVSKNGTEAFSDTLASQNANEALAEQRGAP